MPSPLSALNSLSLIPPQGGGWRFWRGLVVGFLSGCVVSYALLARARQERVHVIKEMPEYVVAAAQA
jgi:hypothetical protein